MNSADLSIVIMGPAGSGKTTIGALVALELGIDFIDADDLHSPHNKEKMAKGVALTDQDRWPWLTKVGDAIAGLPTCVCACSALKRSYRDILRMAKRDIVFIELDGARDLILSRLTARSGHFMPSSQIDSQLADLEPLSSDETGFRVLVDRNVGETVAAVSNALADYAAQQPNRD
jgi:carbohydrate kinase (thermoresistant glucokinase family)